MTETASAYQWLYTTLANDATLLGLVGGRVYRNVAPQGAAMPFLVFSYQGGYDVLGVGAVRIMSSLVCAVRAVGLWTGYDTLRQIADRADALLHAAQGTQVLACVREFPLDYVETDAGIVYAHVGGQYRLLVQ